MWGSFSGKDKGAVRILFANPWLWVAFSLPAARREMVLPTVVW
jgi:hypothetical protein